MKNLITAVAITMFACSAAYATGLSEPVMDPQVIAADTAASTSSAEVVISALVILMIILAGSRVF